MILTAGVLFACLTGCKIVKDAPRSEQTAEMKADAPETATPQAMPSYAPSPEPTEEPDPEPTPEPTAQLTPEPSSNPVLLRANEIIDAMTEREKICQLFIVYPEHVAGVPRVTQSGELLAEGFSEYPVGGLVYSADSLVTSEQVKEMTAGAQKLSKLGLFICADEEGGTVNRLMHTIGTTYIGPMFSYRNDGADTARNNARTIAADMAVHGFNTNFAPVADVWSNPANTVIGSRAYSDDFAQAAELVAAAVEGFHEVGVLCVLKHFPGHGDTLADSHNTSAYVYKTEEQLMEQEMLPFISGIEAGADMVMIGHLTVEAISPVPATVSYDILTGLLRGKLGFDGVIITDGLEMSALTDLYSDGEIAVRCILAGADILLGPGDLGEAVSAIEAALDNGSLTLDRIEESVRRILAIKLKYGIINTDPRS